uniref:Uncharacterized protein n=1 Tax=Timema poppense TaxID=170557 RepID=A0A7R9CJM1_TIMPO|nr:unnamed protein product [Timema poppensis]
MELIYRLMSMFIKKEVLDKTENHVEIVKLDVDSKGNLVYTKEVCIGFVTSDILKPCLKEDKASPAYLLGIPIFFFFSGHFLLWPVDIPGVLDSSSQHHACFQTGRALRVNLIMAVHGVPSKRKEIYKYEAPWPLYSMNWSVRPDKRFRLALGSFVEEYNNKVQVVSLDEDTSEFSAKSTFDHPYPTTKIMWIPDSKGVFPDLLATSGDYLHFCAPLTSFDWNEVDPNLIGTSSIDTTCTIWGLETGQVLGRVNLVTGHVKTQLIAHDKEVYDIAFSRAGGGRDMFASVGADGSVRMFDLRHLEHSTIIYEDPQHTPLLRLAWNKQDPNYLATVAMDACEVIILDVRVPCTPVARLNNHRACVNGIAWAPHSSCHICTAGYDHQALIWDIQQMPRAIEDPILAYTAAEGEINQIQWGATQPDWIAICYNKALEILRV